MSIVRSDRALDVVVDDGVIPGAAGDGAATDHRSSISVATPSNLRCSHVVLLKTVSPRVNSGVAKNARYPRICVRIVERVKKFWCAFGGNGFMSSVHASKR